MLAHLELYQFSVACVGICLMSCCDITYCNMAIKYQIANNFNNHRGLFSIERCQGMSATVIAVVGMEKDYRNTTVCPFDAPVY